MFNFPILRTNTELKAWCKQQKSITLVPTMGALHKGHGQLIDFAKHAFDQQNHRVLVSVFVNPLQFGPNEDFEKYPRTSEKDCELTFNSGGDAIWLPTIKQIFPEGADNYFKIQVPKKLESYLCGQRRKGHFNGVASVLIRLINIVKPTNLILGEKDWQQLIIIRKLIEELNLPIRLRSCPTYRESDGLAYSSRNYYLTKEERVRAQILPKVLDQAAQDFQDGKELKFNDIESSLRKNELEIEYLERVDIHELQPLTQSKKLCLLATAVKIGQTRLIDHKFLMTRKPIVAIDGPAGAGKSTVTKAFAKKLGLLYLDTGAMYRAVTWKIQDSRIDPSDEESISQILQDLELNLELTAVGDQKIMINGIDVTEVIRSPEITAGVSIIASKKKVREILTSQQKTLGNSGGLIAEGRDIGTAVFPDAELKIFLTASESERAERRYKDLIDRGFKPPALQQLEEQIIERDELDRNRDIAPLTQANDAIELITDGMSINEVINELFTLFRARIPEEVWPSPKH